MKKDLEYYMNLNYPVEILKIPEDEGGGFSASIPQLGKYTYVAHGDTIKEAIENLNQTKKYFFERDLNEGIRIPEPVTDDISDFSGKFVLRMSRSLHMKLKRQADENNISMNQWIVELLSARSEGSSVRSRHSELLENIAQMLKSGSRAMYVSDNPDPPEE